MKFREKKEFFLKKGQCGSEKTLSILTCVIGVPERLERKSREVEDI